jgi:phasin family protein
MAKTTTGTNGFLDLAKVFGDLRIPGFDVEAIMEAQRKNFEAFTEANQIAAAGVRALTQRHSEIVQQAVTEASTLFRDWTEASAPEDRIAKGAEAAKQAFERAWANARELNELSSKASADTFNVIARRVAESFDEVRLYAKKQAAAAAE